MERDRTGRTLEQAVGRIQTMLDPASTVSYRDRLVNRLGIEREFDVVVRGHFGGQPMIGVIECKDWDRKVGTPELDAFITKTRDMNVNLRMMVSPKGFTGPALVQAKDAGVGVFSLLPDDHNDAGFSVGLLWYARVYSWTALRWELRFHGKSPNPGSFSSEDIHFRGRPLQNIVKREISTRHSDSSDLRSISISAVFNPYVRVHILGIPFNISSFLVKADRTAENMCKFIQMTGDAIYNWETGTASIPSGASISMHGLTSDMSRWDPFDGEIPPEAGRAPYQILVTRHMNWSDEELGPIPVIPRLKLVTERY